MPAPGLIRFMAVSMLLAGGATAEPINADQDLIYPVNPPRPVLQTEHVEVKILDDSQKADSVVPPVKVTNERRHFQIEKIDPLPTDGRNTMAVAIIASLQNETVEPRDVTTQCLFYEKHKDGSIQMSPQRRILTWTPMPVVWSNRSTEVLALSNEASPDPNVSPAGVVVAVYYQTKLQDVRSIPADLAEKFPPMTTLSVRPHEAASRTPYMFYLQCYNSITVAEVLLYKQPARAQTMLDEVITNLTELKKQRPDWESASVDGLLSLAQKYRESVN